MLHTQIQHTYIDTGTSHTQIPHILKTTHIQILHPHIQTLSTQKYNSQKHNDTYRKKYYASKGILHTERYYTLIPRIYT